MSSSTPEQENPDTQVVFIYHAEAEVIPGDPPAESTKEQ